MIPISIPLSQVIVNSVCSVICVKFSESAFKTPCSQHILLCAVEVGMGRQGWLVVLLTASVRVNFTIRTVASLRNKSNVRVVTESTIVSKVVSLTSLSSLNNFIIVHLIQVHLASMHKLFIDSNMLLVLSPDSHLIMHLSLLINRVSVFLSIHLLITLSLFN